MNRLYQLAEEKLLSGDIDWITDDIKCVLIDTADYTVDFDLDEFLDDIPGAAVVATSANLTDKGVTTGVATANDAEFSLVTGDQCEAVVVYKDTGVAGTSSLIAYLDTLTGFPVTPGGGNITVAWDAGVVFYLANLEEGLPFLSVADAAAREALDVIEGTMVWQQDTNEYWTFVDGATPYWDLVWPVAAADVSVDDTTWGIYTATNVQDFLNEVDLNLQGNTIFVPAPYTIADQIQSTVPDMSTTILTTTGAGTPWNYGLSLPKAWNTFNLYVLITSISSVTTDGGLVLGYDSVTLQDGDAISGPGSIAPVLTLDPVSTEIAGKFRLIQIVSGDSGPAGSFNFLLFALQRMTGEAADTCVIGENAFGIGLPEAWVAGVVFERAT